MELKRTGAAIAMLCVLCMTVFVSICGFAGCGREEHSLEKRVVMSLGKPVNTLDPVLANDTASQYVCGAFYDTLLQYAYDEGTYRLEPCMLTGMPKVSDDGLSYTCSLRDDLYFQDGAAHAGLARERRRVTARDVAFSVLRLADTRLHSPGFWLIRGKLLGLDEFRKRTEQAAAGDLSPYDVPCEGIEAVDERTVVFHLTEPDPRFLYTLALPYTAVVSRRAVEFHGADFADHPEGSGPFRLAKWEKDYVIEMARYGEYHPEQDGRTLPASDAVTCYLVKQPIASWLMFLQGRLDLYVPDAECFEAIVDKNLELSPALLERGVRMLSRMQLETNYIGFSFTDPLLGRNVHLRRAISLAFNKNGRVSHSGMRFSAAGGPVPPGIAGAEESGAFGPYGKRDIEAAKKELELAGYPGGIDPATGEHLSISFDQTGSDTFYRQTAELMSNDLAEIGIKITPEFNTRPRFEQKLKSGSIQLFRYSWTADYPDAENFLQLFYGPNAGSCNRVSYRDEKYDAMYLDFVNERDPVKYAEKAHGLTLYLQEQCPWIFETHTRCFVLVHAWLSGYYPHDFAFNRWKYLDADARKRTETVRTFKPFRMSELVQDADQ